MVKRAKLRPTSGTTTMICWRPAASISASTVSSAALIRADRGDRWGNLNFHATARNFNPVMAMAATHAIVEVRELSDAPLDPETVVTPGIFVQGVVEYGVRP